MDPITLAMALLAFAPSQQNATIVSPIPIFIIYGNTHVLHGTTLSVPFGSTVLAPPQVYYNGSYYLLVPQPLQFPAVQPVTRLNVTFVPLYPVKTNMLQYEDFSFPDGVPQVAFVFYNVSHHVIYRVERFPVFLDSGTVLVPKGTVISIGTVWMNNTFGLVYNASVVVTSPTVFDPQPKYYAVKLPFPLSVAVNGMPEYGSTVFVPVGTKTVYVPPVQDATIYTRVVVTPNGNLPLSALWSLKKTLEVNISGVWLPYNGSTYYTGGVKYVVLNPLAVLQGFKPEYAVFYRVVIISPQNTSEEWLAPGATVSLVPYDNGVIHYVYDVNGTEITGGNVTVTGPLTIKVLVKEHTWVQYLRYTLYAGIAGLSIFVVYRFVSRRL
jgi:hypothetical protein